MNEVAAEAAQEEETIDQAIQQVENLYRKVTGKDAPPASEQPYQAIPPEKAPEQFVTEQVDRLLDALGRIGGPTRSPSWSPPLALWEGGNEIVVRLDLPGVPQSSVQVRASSGRIEVSGHRNPRPQDRNPPLEPRYIESIYGEFRRVVDLTGTVLGAIRVNAPAFGMPALVGAGLSDPPPPIPGQQTAFLTRLRASDRTEAFVHVATAPPRDTWPGATFLGRGVVVHVDRGDAMP